MQFSVILKTLLGWEFLSPLQGIWSIVFKPSGDIYLLGARHHTRYKHYISHIHLFCNSEDVNNVIILQVSCFKEPSIIPQSLLLLFFLAFLANWWLYYQSINNKLATQFSQRLWAERLYEDFDNIIEIFILIIWFIFILKIKKIFISRVITSQHRYRYLLEVCHEKAYLLYFYLFTISQLSQISYSQHQLDNFWLVTFS